MRSRFEFIGYLFYGAVLGGSYSFLFRVYRGLFLPFCSIINPHIACYARLMMKQNHQKHTPDSLRNKFTTASVICPHFLPIILRGQARRPRRAACYGHEHF